MARAGIASRRECDRIIARGVVFINGSRVTTAGARVLPGDSVRYQGEAVRPLDHVTAVLNKPIGYETTLAEGPRRTILDLIRDLPNGTVPVGRLDINTGGLLILSGDGVLVHRLTHPSWGVEREYRLHLQVEAAPELLKRLTKGAVIGRGETSVPLSVRKSGGRSIDVVLGTGRNREVRRLAEACSVPLSGLERIRYGSISIGTLPRGSLRILTKTELRGLRRLVKL